MTEHPKYRLDEREAFLAMSLLVNRFAERAGDDLITLIADIMMMEDGGTSDPAAWHDWLGCVRDVKDVKRVAGQPIEETPSGG